MLPTMLVYRGGDLVYNWVRVDWEAGKTGVEGLLVKHRVLPISTGNCGFPSDSEEDLDLEEAEFA
ncbi:hypothetical protein BDM02DRAFT_3111227 [Thelephora ganbajun]|uniref:Uncharacterized protein n=1 Tax=Thelephora ganbajun TaxID=370292 RepID=A0ACB6ZMW2_THEGA|nr:hypothetical protein BDM02DRAFT_3111227 [Thelephora ganbajun]